MRKNISKAELITRALKGDVWPSKSSARLPRARRIGPRNSGPGGAVPRISRQRARPAALGLGGSTRGLELPYHRESGSPHRPGPRSVMREVISDDLSSTIPPPSVPVSAAFAICSCFCRFC